MKPNEKKWIRPDDFEALYGVPIKTQNQWRHKKEIPYSKKGNYVWYDREKIDKILENNEISIQDN
ncbi:hypothetical protein PGH07_01220 [Sulfurovum sp. zt1-1]|uniref:Helix-turn-helix domain-containing protein n=1 Tax=Sulfurovum zhangzhouensis TaxID=3019067 RepID=A0ABT7QVC9_9BACT|nr:hypothetical protein [Sulfurovum zhangzhouensis]MDM5270792.1 hypothetical protein [Sulfurovum zhangzhouensis]